MRKAMWATLLMLLVSTGAAAQMLVMDKGALQEFTSQNPYDRFPDGRPKVPDRVLERLKAMSSEEAWAVLQSACAEARQCYKNQFEGNWQILHPERKLIGRAVTAQFMPMRPDLNAVINAKAKAAGLAPSQNERVIELLQPGDVVVVDLFGKVENGTFVGDNLATAIFAQSKTGMVIDGGIRDLEGIFPVEMAAYFRGAHPSALAPGEVMLAGINIPIRIGNVTVMPGDVVFGDREGVIFIPPHLAEKVADAAEATQLHDEFTKMKIKEGKYKIRDVYPLNKELQKEFEEWKKKRTAGGS
jgi:4-hydroxy-4-methyl-2-oxoglutarate aldolase